MANGFRGNGQNSGDRFGRIPTTQIIEKREENVQSAVKNPIAQARHLALGWAGLVLSIILALLSLGPVVFWLATFVVSAATFLWFLLQAARTEYVNEKGSHIGVTPSEALAGFLVSALVGFIAWSLWQVLASVAVDIVLPHWLASWLPNLTALASLIGMIFSLAYIVHLEPAFLQELLYRSPAIEQSLGNLISQTEAPWHVGRIQKPTRPLPPQTVDIRIEHIDENDNVKPGLFSELIPSPYTYDQLVQIAKTVTTDGISEDLLCGNGKPFPGGAGGRKDLAEFKQIIEQRNWGEEKVEGSPTQGHKLTKLGENVFHRIAGTTPPHREVTKTDAEIDLHERTNERTDAVSAESGQDMKEMIETHPDGEPDEWSGELPTPDGEW
ncbi:MAG: hypothetical protein ABIG63_17710 [Chloroflexota bacterium]